MTAGKDPPPKPVLKWRLLFFTGFLITVLWYMLLRRVKKPYGPGGKYTPEFMARHVRVAIERLGGLWIKAAQILAMRRDLFSKVFCDELGKLHDHAHGFPGEVACKIIEEELGCPLEEVFEQFDLIPIAAASIGQVHVGRLRENGVKVAVKVQRPTIAISFARDLQILRTYLSLLKLLQVRPWARWDDMYWSLKQTLSDELDYRLEVASMRRMRRTLRKDKVYIPKAFTRYSKKRVIVMEFIDGVLMSEYIHAIHDRPAQAHAWCKENNVKPKKIGRRLYLNVLKQGSEDNLIHGDLHPGNIMLLKNSRFALIDLGSVGSMDVGFLEKYNLCLKAMLRRDFSKYVDVLMTMAPGLPNVDIDTMKQEMMRELEAWESLTDVKGVPYEQRSVTGLNSRFNEIMGRYRFPPFWELLRLTRTTAAVDASLRFLLPEINFFKLTQRHYESRRGRMLKYMASKSSRNEAVSAINDLMQLPAKLGENIVFQAELVRKRAISFQGQISKAAEVGKVLVSMLMNIGLIAMVLMIARYLNKQTAVGQDVIAYLPVRDLFASMPRLSGGMWVVVIILSFYLLQNMAKLVRILGFRGVGTNPYLGGGT
ncbi:ABC1 kinase family protein [Sorangium sp. So ce131]|uniref:ABC1 kinase family protein n=1 Tax=Sorangium sp. So ce131 TaxID=3133282 RepID=UPI003F5EEDA6